MREDIRHGSILSLSVSSAQRNAAADMPPPSSTPCHATSSSEQDGTSDQYQCPLPPLPPSVPDFHRIAYVEWGRPESPRTIVCVHGFARNGRDFDAFAEKACADARVVCPDMVGRGRSDFLSDPALVGGPADCGYNYAQYQLDVAAVVARLGVEQVDWLGTSLGGLLGMMVAANPKSFVRRLVMNDVGPMVPGSLLETMVDYLGTEHVFNSFEELEAFIRLHYVGTDKFGALSNSQVRHLTKFSERKLPSAKVGLAFDHEAIRVPKWMRDNGLALPSYCGWDVWSRVRCPVFVLRGANSTALTVETAERMRREGPKATVVVVPDCGHAPALMDEAQIDLVNHWLKALTIDRKALDRIGGWVLGELSRDTVMDYSGPMMAG